MEKWTKASAPAAANTPPQREKDQGPAEVIDNPTEQHELGGTTIQHVSRALGLTTDTYMDVEGQQQDDPQWPTVREHGRVYKDAGRRSTRASRDMAQPRKAEGIHVLQRRDMVHQHQQRKGKERKGEDQRG
jgi:hypothetical protein